ncbi:EAL domain-containing protein [Halomonas smyrnensis]|uniref:putative bifunctional diguanylate cyclase/phosphodiesterase n=1 Tax=Halomonas smyrnensis TaxID=720605 RepID=UPI00047508BB
MGGRHVKRIRDRWLRWCSTVGTWPASGKHDREDVRAIQRLHQDSEQRFRVLLENLPRVAVQGYDRQRRVIYWNDASARLYGYPAEEAMGRLLEDLIIPDPMRQPVVEAHRAWVEQGQAIPADELELRHRSGEPVPVFSHHVMLGEHTDNPLMFCVDIDLSDQKRAHRDLAFATRFDQLTHLPNRQTFEADLDERLDRCRRQGRSLTVLYLDIDHFAEINDALGYAQGDQILIELTRRLRHRQRSGDLMSRVSGDEFVMAFPGVGDAEARRTVVENVRSAFDRPFEVDGIARPVTASLGLSVFPDHGRVARELIRNADVAKNRAKLDGQGALQGFQQHFHDELVRQHRLAERLEHAIANRELSLHYQPQVSAVSGRIENLEALLRWEPADGEAVSPAEFIPLAERSGLIERLGNWVMEEACRQQAAWRAAGVEALRIDINLSGRQVRAPETLERLEACVARHGLEPQDIGIELTENVLIEANEGVLTRLRRLYHRGVRIAIDDFGTGYSSLSYLKLFPVTALKIDRSFVRDAPQQPEDRAIMEATVFIGHRLGLEVVAEGVETGEQLALVREMRCDLVQGYYFHRPLPVAEVQRLLLAQLEHAP